MSEFIASNGRRVVRFPYGVVSVTNSRGTTTLAVGEVEALREFFRDERDTELGRWRWPEHPEYVVYPAEKKILDESTTYTWRLFKRGESGPQRSDKRASVFFRAAVAYYEAHPEPKPWHDAKRGEAWLLTIDGQEVLALRDVDENFVSTTRDYRVIQYNREDITAGRRVWPEESND